MKERRGANPDCLAEGYGEIVEPLAARLGFSLPRPTADGRCRARVLILAQATIASQLARSLLAESGDVGGVPEVSNAVLVMCRGEREELVQGTALANKSDVTGGLLDGLWPSSSRHVSVWSAPRPTLRDLTLILCPIPSGRRTRTRA